MQQRENNPLKNRKVIKIHYQWTIPSLTEDQRRAIYIREDLSLVLNSMP